MIPAAAVEEFMAVKRQPGEYERDTVLRGLEAALPELLVPEVVKHIVDDLIADMYHPEFGTEWREPDGSLWKITNEIEKRARAEEARRISRAIKGYAKQLRIVGADEAAKAVEDAEALFVTGGKPQ